MQEKGMALRKDGFWVADPMPESLALLHEGKKHEDQPA
jgi:hypothetical protein